MKTIKLMIFALSTISMLVLTPMNADAHRWGGGGGWGRGFFYGAALGLAWPGPWWYARPYYYPYPGYYFPYSTPTQSVVVVPQTTPSVQMSTPIAPAPQYWYYCESTSTYYPYVQSCDREWRMVPVTPPAPTK